MKKTISILLVAMLAITALFALTACSPKGKTYVCDEVKIKYNDGASSLEKLAVDGAKEIAQAAWEGAELEFVDEDTYKRGGIELEYSIDGNEITLASGTVGKLSLGKIIITAYEGDGGTVTVVLKVK